MSAPSSFDAVALHLNVVRALPRQRPPSRRATGAAWGDRIERRRVDPIARLARRHDELCTQAVDASEIAAGLEAAGVGDREAREQYGVGCVFELAGLLYAAVPRRPVLLEAGRDPWSRAWHSHALRGLLYAAPGLFYVLALRALHPTVDVAVLVAVSAAGSALSQGLALLGHLLRGRLDTRAAGTLLRGAVLLGGPVLGLCALVGCRLVGAPTQLGLVAVVQIAYLLAATVLLVVDADRVLLAVLVAIGLAAGLAAGFQRSATLLLAVLAAGVLATCVLAVRAVPRGGQGRPLRQAVGRHELALATRQVACGAAYAGLVSFLVLDVLSRRAPLDRDLVAPAMAPLVASLGLAEWLVHRLRSRGRATLGAATSPAAFRRAARRRFVVSLVGYTLALAGLAAVVEVGLAVVGSRPDDVLVLDTAACAVLGVGLFLSTTLQSLGRARVVLALAPAAFVADLAVRAAAPEGGGAGLAFAHLVVFGCLAALLLPSAITAYSDVTGHR